LESVEDWGVCVCVGWCSIEKKHNFLYYDILLVLRVFTLLNKCVDSHKTFVWPNGLVV